MLPRFSLVTALFLGMLVWSPLFSETTTTISYLPGPMILTQDTINKNPNVRLTSIEFEGLHRVSPNTLKTVIDIHLGDPLHSINLSEIHFELLKANLFESVKFYYQPMAEGYKIIIKVKEPSQIELIPYFSLNRNTIILGGATINSEIQGNTSKVLGTTLWQRGGITGKLGYVNPELYDGNGTFSLFFSGGQDEQKQCYSDGTEFRTFSGYTGNVISKLQVNQNRMFQPGFQVEYEMLELNSSWEAGGTLPDSSEMLGTGISLTYDTTYYLYYFREGSEITFELARGFIVGPREGNYYGSIEAGKTFNIFHRSNLTLYADGGFNFTDPLHYNDLFGIGFRVLPKETTVDRLYFTGAAEYEMPIAQPSFGTLSGFTFFETGIYSPLKNTYEFFFGPGLGFRFYMKKVETPVFGFHMGLNTLKRKVDIDFYIGMRF